MWGQNQRASEQSLEFSILWLHVLIVQVQEAPSHQQSRGALENDAKKNPKRQRGTMELGVAGEKVFRKSNALGTI
jgi:hypothetical protein